MVQNSMYYLCGNGHKINALHFRKAFQTLLTGVPSRSLDLYTEKWEPGLQPSFQTFASLYFLTMCGYSCYSETKFKNLQVRKCVQREYTGKNGIEMEYSIYKIRSIGLIFKNLSRFAISAITHRGRRMRKREGQPEHRSEMSWRKHRCLNTLTCRIVLASVPKFSGTCTEYGDSSNTGTKSLTSSRTMLTVEVSVRGVLPRSVAWTVKT